MSRHSLLARQAILSNFFNATTRMHDQLAAIESPSDSTFGPSSDTSSAPPCDQEEDPDRLMPPPKTVVGRALGTNAATGGFSSAAAPAGAGNALADTPISTAPPSPQIHPFISGTSTPSKPRATTLDIPGLTKSKVSPDGRIAQRDVGSKLVIVMVGLPARGKSYITKKLSRYLNWLQHDTRIFNVGERRRVAASSGPADGAKHEQENDHHNSQNAPENSSQDAFKNDAEQEPQPEANKISQNESKSNNASKQDAVGELHNEIQDIPVITLQDTDENTIKEGLKAPASVEDELRDSVRSVVDDANSSQNPEVHRQVEAIVAIPAARILMGGKALEDPRKGLQSASPMTDLPSTPAETILATTNTDKENKATTAKTEGQEREVMDQSAGFFDPDNERALQIRERLALQTLDELLDYILEQGGSVGILDATNSTLKRRKAIMQYIRARAGPDLNILFVESQCLDQNLLESNMLLKLSGPDYKGMDPTVALADFKQRVKLYEKSYVPLGEYEEINSLPYVKTIDVCRKVVSFEVNGFLSSQVVYYLLNFNLSPRQIWISRHGESLDDRSGKIGGDSPLSDTGIAYAEALAGFIGWKRCMWELNLRNKAEKSHFPPRPGDSTPPNPQRSTSQGIEAPRNFCVWSSMMQRSIQTVQFFNEEQYDVKQMRMLDELNAGKMEGLTYEQIRAQYPEEYAARRREKLHYRYPGVGGEGYLDVINRLRAVIVEVERMTDHVLLVGPRSVARILLAYFLGLKREILTDLDVPPGTIYALEPKPYGVELNVFRYNAKTNWFEEMPNYELKHETYY
ncbi:6-phosphofructo-2-kinase [Ophidiomyces ophidiicola]|nr:6-phosphofructo-2-kinase [Ophidiomyces ophidiicola]